MKIVNKVTGLALLAGTAISGASMASAATTTPKPTPPAQTQGVHHQGANIDALAKSLGVSKAKLEAAFTTLHKNHESKAFNPKAARPDLAADLSKQLGLDKAKVQKALDANKPKGDFRGPGRGFEDPSHHLPRNMHQPGSSPIGHPGQNHTGPVGPM